MDSQPQVSENNFDLLSILKIILDKKYNILFLTFLLISPFLLFNYISKLSSESLYGPIASTTINIENVNSSEFYNTNFIESTVIEATKNLNGIDVEKIIPNILISEGLPTLNNELNRMLDEPKQYFNNYLNSDEEIKNFISEISSLNKNLITISIQLDNGLGINENVARKILNNFQSQIILLNNYSSPESSNYFEDLINISEDNMSNRAFLKFVTRYFNYIDEQLIKIEKDLLNNESILIIDQPDIKDNSIIYKTFRNLSFLRINLEILQDKLIYSKNRNIIIDIKEKDLQEISDKIRILKSNRAFFSNMVDINKPYISDRELDNDANNDFTSNDQDNNLQPGFYFNPNVVDKLIQYAADDTMMKEKIVTYYDRIETLEYSKINLERQIKNMKDDETNYKNFSNEEYILDINKFQKKFNNFYDNFIKTTFIRSQVVYPITVNTSKSMRLFNKYDYASLFLITLFLSMIFICLRSFYFGKYNS